MIVQRHQRDLQRLELGLGLLSGGGLGRDRRDLGGGRLLQARACGSSRLHG